MYAYAYAYAYASGWAGTDTEVVSAMLWWQDRCQRGIRGEAEAGDPAMQALVVTGVLEDVRNDYDWTTKHLGGGEVDALFAPSGVADWRR